MANMSRKPPTHGSVQHSAQRSVERSVQRSVQCSVQCSVEHVFRECWRLRWARSKNHRDTYRTVEELCDLLGRMRPVSDLSLADVNRLMLAWQDAGLSNARINRKTAVLRPLLRHAHEMGFAPAPPPVRSLREGGGRERFLTRPEAASLIRCLPDLYQPLVEFLLHTGARYGEAVALRWADLGDASVTFRWSTTKGGKTRIVPISWEHVTRPEPVEGRAGPFSHIEYDAFHTAFRRAVGAAGIRDGHEVVPHTLRHTCASWMAQAGVPIRHIQKWLGHASVVTTERYAKLTDTDLTMALDAITGDRVHTASGSRSFREGLTPVRTVKPSRSATYLTGECPERQRGGTVNPDNADENQSFIDLYSVEEINDSNT